MPRLIIIVISLVLAVVLGLTLTWPKYQNLNSIQANIERQENELQSKTAYFSQIKDISEELVEYEDELSKISSALPLSLSLPSLFYFLQKTASETGLILKDITLIGVDVPKVGTGAEKQQLSRAKEIRVNLTLAGSYTSIKDFLLAVEKSAKLIEVSSLSFLAEEKEESEGIFTFKVDVKTYSY